MSYEDNDTELAYVRCVIIHRTENAMLIRQGVKEFWVPRSLCRTSILGFNKDNPSRRDATVEMPEWLAEEKGIDYV